MRLYYQQAGRGTRPFVFVHGWCCDHTFFEPQFEHFKATHSVTALDLRGCGNSDQPEGGYDISTLADDVAFLCGELGLSKPVIVGHSLGGMIGIDLASRYPSLPGAIVGVDPGPIDPLPRSKAFFAEFPARLEGPDGDAVRRAFVAELFLETDTIDRNRIVETMCSVPARVAAAVIRGVNAWNGVEALKGCRVPLLILMRRPGLSNDPARLLPHKPDVQFGITVGAGHFHHLEAPEQVTPMIDRFVRNALGR